jgi:hypothetical protein
MSIGLQIAAIIGIVVGMPALGWLVFWRLYRTRRLCPACKQRALRFVLGYRPTSTAYFMCVSCGAHLRAEVSFFELTLVSCGIRLCKREYNYAAVSDQEWRKFNLDKGD